MVAAVLFDLDGTLADTARDLGRALNLLLAEEGRSPIALEAVRPHVSGGARALLQLGFGLVPGNPAYDGHLRRFLAHYEAGICVETVLFEGMAELLAALEERALPWGVVTNKSERYTVELMQALGLSDRAACMVGGDSTPRPKPAPDPLLLACALIGCRPADACYVGDDLRDIVAGKAAGLTTIAARYGYLGKDLPVEQWDADYIVDAPGEVLERLASMPAS